MESAQMQEVDEEDDVEVVETERIELGGGRRWENQSSSNKSWADVVHEEEEHHHLGIGSSSGVFSGGQVFTGALDGVQLTQPLMMGPPPGLETEKQAFVQRFPIVEEMGMGVGHFLGQDLEGLSMGQLDELLMIHQELVEQLHDQKLEVARQQERERMVSEVERRVLDEEMRR
eukprot:TRINITY_DN2235_c1_g2_i1.p1 TRINITY_DN2235_c1_g2~~TRINITY_DN2235_c1_g2_i1.p1  ORF type:complete len:173 (+),score=66.37 TRINITY_DN2235_c1_g2_i1:403-921(+)